MHILMVFATEGESGLLRRRLSMHQQSVFLWQGQAGSHTVDLLHTGIGMVNTALRMGRQVAQVEYGQAIQLGIAGSFAREIALGDVVEVEEDIYAEMGADSPTGYLDLQALGFPAWWAAEQPRYNRLRNPQAGSSGWPLVRAITVNRVHGTAERIAETRQQWQPDIESMEGAAFFQVALEAGLPFLALRSISNYVEPRNRAGWDIPRALQGLERAALALVEGL